MQQKSRPGEKTHAITLEEVTILRLVRSALLDITSNETSCSGAMPGRISTRSEPDFECSFCMFESLKPFCGFGLENTPRHWRGQIIDKMDG